MIEIRFRSRQLLRITVVAVIVAVLDRAGVAHGSPTIWSPLLLAWYPRLLTGANKVPGGPSSALRFCHCSQLSISSGAHSRHRPGGQTAPVLHSDRRRRRRTRARVRVVLERPLTGGH